MTKFVDVYQISDHGYSLTVFRDTSTGEYGWFYETLTMLFDRYNKTYEQAMKRIESFKKAHCR